MNHMSATQLKSYLDNSARRPVLLDVREPWEYRICHIEDSQLVPMNQIMRVLNEYKPDDELVLICHHGVRSQRVGAFLAQAGFRNIVNLDGGINAWAREVDPGMPTY
jgi:rhodanese-related sulfurtransferase